MEMSSHKWYLEIVHFELQLEFQAWFLRNLEIILGYSWVCLKFVVNITVSYLQSES